MSIVKNIFFFILISIAITIFAYYLESDFLFKYLRDNLISLLLTLLAINTATLGLIASKIQDIVIKHPNFDFSKTIREMKLSLLEQIILIVVSVFCLLINDSKVVCFNHKDIFCNIILISIFIYAIHILWDTGKAVFVSIEEVQKFHNTNNV